MKIIIAGAGLVGIGLAKYLRAENHDIVLIDSNKEQLGNLSEQLDIQTITGIASYPDVLEQAGARNGDIFLAMTGSDETNIVSSGVAKSVFNIPQIIARISSSEYLSPKYNAFLKSQAIDVVLSPELETANRILERLSIPSSVDLVSLNDNKLIFLGLRVKKNTFLFSKSIGQLNTLFQDKNISIVAVHRRHRLMPLENVVLRHNDDIYFTIENKQLNDILKALEYDIKTPENVVIFGGGRVGFEIANQIECQDFCPNATIIEQNSDRAHFLAEKLNNTLVIQGDGLDEALLDTLNLDTYQLAITTTLSDESNILLALLAKKYGIERTCALMYNQLYTDLTAGLGIDVSIDPNAVLISVILGHLRKNRMKSDYFIQSGVGEIIEVQIKKASKITKSPLGKMNMPQGVQICAIMRENMYIKPENQIKIQVNDTVILFVKKGNVQAMDKLFSTGFSLF